MRTAVCRSVMTDTPPEDDTVDELQHEHMPTMSLEPVLLVPPKEVPSTWTMLLKARCIPQFWHLGGRFGGRVRGVEGDTRRGIPVPVEIARRIREGGDEQMKSIVDFVALHNIEIRNMKPLPSKRVPRRQQGRDGTVHPERRRAFTLPTAEESVSLLTSAADQVPFSFAELFAGIGGFRRGLEALGGKCVFSSEIDADCIQCYSRNFGETPSGDICHIAAADIPDHDMLVGGFPCQPFSREGLQPGFADKKGDGMLFLEIVRILREKHPKAFLLENVPGLLACDEGKTFAAIKEALEVDGCYAVKAETINSRCLTAQSRNRVYFVGIRKQRKRSRAMNEEQHVLQNDSEEEFNFPFIPDLALCFSDIVETDEEMRVGSSGLASAENYTLTDTQFDKLRKSHLWNSCGPNGRMAWGGKLIETLISNYGHCISNGSSVVVPRPWPHNPRRLTARECSRLMGFPDLLYDLGVPAKTPDSNDYPAGNVWFKAHYRMLGNAVCPPIICAIGGAILQHCHCSTSQNDWEAKSLTTAIFLAFGALSPAKRIAALDRLKRNPNL